MPDKIHTLPIAIHLYLGARLFKAGLKQPRVTVTFKFRCESLTSKFIPEGKKKSTAYNTVTPMQINSTSRQYQVVNINEMLIIS